MYRVDRNAYGDGLMIFIRNDICFYVITRFNVDMSSFRPESLLLKVKINKSWFAIVGVYGPPNIPKSQWKRELIISAAIFEAATTISNDTIFLGDFNCDVMEPNRPPMDELDLCDLLDIYNLKKLITSPTRTTEKQQCRFLYYKQQEKNTIIGRG